MGEREIPEQPIDTQGEHQEARDTVYRLTRPEDVEPLLDGTLEAPENRSLVQVLGDNLIDVWAVQNNYEGPYRPGMRREAIFAYPDAIPTDEIPRLTNKPKDQVELDVDPSRVYAAQMTQDTPLYAGSWQRAKSYILTHTENVSEAMVDEVLEFVAQEPDQKVPATWSPVDHMPARIRASLLEYFDAPIRAYVESFQPLSAYRQHPEGDNVEVIIPGGQIKAAHPYQEGA